MTLKTVEQIISDKDMHFVGGTFGVGTLPPRQVLAEGVLKYAMGYSTGYTVMDILRTHKLITAGDRSGRRVLTVKGQEYLRAAWDFRLIVSIPDMIKALAGAELDQIDFLHECRKYADMADREDVKYLRSVRADRVAERLQLTSKMARLANVLPDACAPRLSPDGTYYIHEANCGTARAQNWPLEQDRKAGDRHVRSAEDRPEEHRSPGAAVGPEENRSDGTGHDRSPRRLGWRGLWDRVAQGRVIVGSVLVQGHLGGRVQPR